ncbi:hypothetical protein ACCO45_010638 [Purpureocillium lilacinum]|uniref:Uncharacterized protein n=1 Tax=Purpureocillium lilacinum TaxID=33203 RepID=A0ACC4DFG4_PURLI
MTSRDVSPTTAVQPPLQILSWDPSKHKCPKGLREKTVCSPPQPEGSCFIEAAAVVEPLGAGQGRGCAGQRAGRGSSRWQALDVVDVDLLLAALDVGLLVGVGIAELEVGLAVLALAEGVGLVDLGVLRQLAIGLESSGLIGGVLEDNIALVVLEVAQGEEDDVALVNPDLLSHLATDLQ